ncbi:MAG: hypothetical protein PWQ93_697 [Clostridiales bacterium]|jgi:hypothetical protein|nr:hypothetical protein [Clostridiales bacterium]
MCTSQIALIKNCLDDGGGNMVYNVYIDRLKVGVVPLNELLAF